MAHFQVKKKVPLGLKEYRIQERSKMMYPAEHKMYFRDFQKVSKYWNTFDLKFRKVDVRNQF